MANGDLGLGTGEVVNGYVRERREECHSYVSVVVRYLMQPSSHLSVCVPYTLSLDRSRLLDGENRNNYRK